MHRARLSPPRFPVRQGWAHPVEGKGVVRCSSVEYGVSQYSGPGQEQLATGVLVVRSTLALAGSDAWPRVPAEVLLSDPDAVVEAARKIAEADPTEQW